MEANGIVNQVTVYSRSALHSFITGPGPDAPRPKSTVSPYRKRQGLGSFLGLNSVIEEVKREEATEAEAKIVAMKPETEINWNFQQVSEA